MVNSSMGNTCRSRYLVEYHKPRISMGNEAHQTNISGVVMAWRREVNCHGNGANKRLASPMGIVVKAPVAVDTSAPLAKPDLADCAWSDRLTFITSSEPKVSNCAAA